MLYSSAHANRVLDGACNRHPICTIHVKIKINLFRQRFAATVDGLPQDVDRVAVFGAIHHMHDHGEMFSTNLTRGGVGGGGGGAVVETMETEFYDWRFQLFSQVNFTVRRGDVFATECVFNTGNARVSWGPSSADEMCIDFLYYYPRVVGPVVSRSYAGGTAMSAGEIDGARRFGTPGSTPPTLGPPTAPLTTQGGSAVPSSRRRCASVAEARQCGEYECCVQRRGNRLDVLV